MGLENLVQARRSSAANTLRVVTAVFVAGSIVNATQYPFIVGAFFNERVDCTGNLHPKDPRYEFDAIVIPGSGSEKNELGISIPDLSGRNRLDAAALLVERHQARTVVIASGQPLNKEDELIEIDYFKQSLKSRLQGNPVLQEPVVAITEHISINTETNMVELSKIAAEHDLRKIGVVSSRFHVVRATVTACLKGLHARAITAEEVLGIDPEPTSFLIRLKEKLEIMSLLLDPESRLITSLKRATR